MRPSHTLTSLRLLLQSCRTVRSFSSASQLSDGHQRVRELCRDYARKELATVAGRLDEEGRFPAEQIKQLATMGLMSVCIHPDSGGTGQDSLSLAIAVEELSRGCSSTGVIVSIHNCLYANLVQRTGSSAQKQEFLKPFTQGRIGAFALSEMDAGSDVGAISTTAKRDGDHWILNGRKAWVTSGYEADAVIVFATIDKSQKHKGITAFVMDIHTPGISLGKRERKMGIRATSTCDVVLENVRLPETSVLGKLGGGFKMAMEQLDQGRIGIASQAIGIAQAALDTAVRYSQTRQAFGKPIANLQTIKIRLAEMATRIEAARLLVWQAAVAYDSNRKMTKESSMAKLFASECATFVTHNCVQILGGMGYVQDMPAERLYRDARITEIYGGISDVQKMVIADQLLKEYK